MQPSLYQKASVFHLSTVWENEKTRISMNPVRVGALRFPKFRRKSLKIVSAVLRGLKDGLYPSAIARQLGMKANHIHYYLKKLERLGFIDRRKAVVQEQVKTRGAITLYQLTNNGSNFLAEIEKGTLSRKMRLHNCYWLYPILRQPGIKIDWHKAKLRNWGQLIGRELGLSVRKNPESIEIITNPIYGDNPYALLLRSRDEADGLASHLEQKFRLRLGRSRLTHAPHFAIYDPLADKWSKNFRLDAEHGKIDRSMGYGEIDWTDPVSAANYLSMPNRLARIERSMETFAKGMEQHMLLIQELRALVNVLIDVVAKRAASRS